MAKLPHASGGCCLPVPAIGPCLALVAAGVARNGSGCLPFPAAGPSLAVVEAELPRGSGGLPVPASSAAPLVGIKSACGSISFLFFHLHH
jgi:hypothetical protein